MEKVYYIYIYVHTHTHTHTYIYIFQILFHYSLLQGINIVPYAIQ